MRLTTALLTRVGKLTIQHSNLPERYIRRAMRQVYYESPKGKPNYPRRVIERKSFVFSTNRPWTMDFQMENLGPVSHKKVYVEPLKEWNIYLGDRVEILIGDDKGKQGLVAQIFEERNWVIVEGLNTRLERFGQEKDFQGIYILKEQPLLVTSEIALVDPSDLKGCSVEWRYLENGERVRVSCRTGRIIPIPAASMQTIDYKSPKLYNEGSKDTVNEDLEKVTFKPTLKTFDMDIMDSMGIKEDRIRKRTFWY